MQQESYFSVLKGLSKTTMVYGFASGAFVAWFRDPDGHVLSLTQFK